jgi:hypothetical protein
VVFSSGSISIAFSSFVYICIAIGDPVIKMGGLGSSYQDGRVEIQLSRWGLGSSYQDGRVEIQLSRWEGWDPVIKMGGLGTH